MRYLLLFSLLLTGVVSHHAVHAQCTAAFEFFNGNQILQIQFHDLSDDDPDIVSWHWNFGDGHMSDQQNPLYTYAAPGTYLVCLVVENELGCVNDVCHEVIVLDQTCEAAFEWEASGLVVNFIDNSDDDPDIASWSWNFGDGHTSNEANPVHTYAEPGVYVVCLTIVNEFNCTDNICHELHVTESPAVCEAEFEWFNANGNLQIQFHDLSDDDPDIVSWHWNLGDGHMSEQEHPLHTYEEPGVYLVCLIVENELGCISDVCYEVHVGESTGSCEVDFQWFDGNANLQIQFYDLSDDDPDIVSWHWNFGDGHMSDQQHPLHTYAEPGVYLVCLTVENEFGCASDICHGIHVTEGSGTCEAAFEWEGTGLVIQFIDHSHPGPSIVSWHWNFGDGHTSDEANPVHTYAQPGVYVVCLAVVSEIGCASDVCHIVHVGEGMGSCEAAFEWEASGLVVNFIDTSDDDPDIASWSWIFGDGHFSNEANPVHTYAEAGVYTVCLLVINEFGCAADICHQVEVGQGSGTCEAAFEWFPGNEIQQIHFHDLSDDDPDIVSWFWHFGDGHTSDQQHPLHTYGAGGVYLVCLAVVNEFGCVSDICHEVLVPQGIIVGLELNSEIGFAGPWDGLQGALSTRTDKHTNVSSSIFPNPAGQHITLHFELMQPSEISVHLFHAGGQVTAQSVNHIYPAGNNDLGINVDGYAPGIYYLRLHTKEGSWTGKFIKI